MKTLNFLKFYLHFTGQLFKLPQISFIIYLEFLYKFFSNFSQLFVNFNKTFFLTLINYFSARLIENFPKYKKKKKKRKKNVLQTSQNFFEILRVINNLQKIFSTFA